MVVGILRFHGLVWGVNNGFLDGFRVFFVFVVTFLLNNRFVLLGFI